MADPQNILPIDELNSFKANLATHFDENGKVKSKQDEEDIIDELFDLFLLSYASGVNSVNDSLGASIDPPLETVVSIIYDPIAGMTWEERVRLYLNGNGTPVDIERIAETEAHRDANAAAYLAATDAGATEKQWHCMMLDTSRDTHIYLDGVTAPMDGWFYSFMGGHTMYPGQWGIAEEDCNCLCWLTYS